MLDFDFDISKNPGWHKSSIGSISNEIGMGPFGSDIKVETFVKRGIPIISGCHLNDRILNEMNFNFITPEHAQALKRSIVHSGDIIFTHAGNIGQVSIIPKNTTYSEYILSQRQFYLRCNDKIIKPNIMIEFFLSQKGQYELLSNMSQTGVPSIARPTSHLKSIEIAVPPMNLQNEYDKYSETIIQYINHNRFIITQLNKLRDYLLPKLMIGEIDISQLELPTKYSFMGELPCMHDSKRGPENQSDRQNR